MFKFIGFLTVVTVAHAGFLPAAVPLAAAQSVLTKSVEEYDPHPQYNFAYDVQDSISGDSKNQVESRDGDVVHGQYSLIDADGFRRTVDYTADSVNGFNAVVNRVPLGIAAHSVKSVAAPTVIKTTAQIATPINYAASHVDPTLVNVAQYASPRSQIGAQTILQSAFTPAAFASPTLLRSAPIATYSAAAPALVQTAYASPTLLRSNLASFAAPTLLKSASLAPGLQLSGSSAIVKTSYVSPYASYAY